MERGNHLLRFSHKQFGQFGVLICYDFSHFDIVYTMNRHQTETPPEMLFVVANNPASSLYESCCVSDSHRFYQYIIMCNVAQYGGSGVFGPLKTNGPRQTVLSAGLNAEGISIATIDLSGLQKARETFGPSANSDFMKKSGIYQNCGQGAKNGE
jgi:predicted amidohydrolase